MKKFLYNNSVLKERRMELRNNQTKAEKLLWFYLNKNQISGLRFFRQYSVGPYILDFYCPKIRFAIELDGNQHTEKDIKLYDEDRNKYLQSVNISTIRFWNSEVVEDIKTVVDKIKVEIQKFPLP